jgi:hypothetical protein
MSDVLVMVRRQVPCFECLTAGSLPTQGTTRTPSAGVRSFTARERPVHSNSLLESTNRDRSVERSREEGR